MAKPNGRTVVLVGLLVVAGAAFGVKGWDLQRLRGELQARADAHMAGFTEGHNPVEAEDMTAVVTVSRPYVLFGAPQAKVSIYFRNSGQQGVHYTGIDYFYAKAEGEWAVQESGQCTGEECQLDAHTAFQAARP